MSPAIENISIYHSTTVVQGLILNFGNILWQLTTKPPGLPDTRYTAQPRTEINEGRHRQREKIPTSIAEVFPLLWSAGYRAMIAASLMATAASKP